MSDACLIVPVEVSALAVNDTVRTNETFHRWVPNFEKLQKRDDPERNVLINVKDDETFNGVHLHWQVPQALARGRVDLRQGTAPGRPGTDAVTFPLVPNRWLVLRHHRPAKTQETPRTAGWAVESDFLHLTQGTSPYFDATKTGDERSPYIGRKTDLDASTPWSEPGRAPFLTIAGPGLAPFASFAPYNEDVFSLHDMLRLPGQGRDPGPLVAEGALSYLVVGWHSTPGSDPLSPAALKALLTFRGEYRPGMTDAQLFEAGMRALPWRPAESWTEWKAVQRCLYVGTVLDLQWAHTGHPESDKPPLATPGVDVAVGHSATDARTALDDERDPKKRLLNEAFEYGALDLLDDALDNGRDVLDAAAHATWFASTPAGYAWTAVDRRGVADPTRPPTDAELAAEKKALHKLNQDQWAYDRKLRELAVARERLYGLWWLRGLPPGAKPEQPEDFRAGADQQLDPATGGLAATVRDVRIACFGADGKSGLRAAVPQGDTPRELGESIRKYEQKIKLPAGRTLRRVPAEPYHQATDPVVVLRGKGARLELPRTEPLPCRTPRALIAALTDGGAGVPVKQPTGPAHLAAVEAALPWAPLKEVRDEFWLLAEAARRVRTRGGLTAAETLGDAMRRLKLTVRDRQGRAPARLPEFSALWRQPWSPMFLLWTVNAYPLPYRSESHGQGTEHWRFDGRKHAWHGTGQRSHGVLAGRSLLTSLPPFMLRGRVEEYINRYSDARAEELWKRANAPRNRQQIAQELRGLNAWLAQRQISTHFDPLDGKSKDELTTSPVVARPAASHRFEPVRAAQFFFESLTLVDRFGRSAPLAVDGSHSEKFLPKRAASVLPTPGKTVVKDMPNRLVQLPPRLQQPARVCLELVSARDERRTLHPADQPGYRDPVSPVCGWVVPDRRHKSLLIHSADGRGLGELLVAGRPENEEVRWLPLPGSPILDKDDLATPQFARDHPHLAPFLAEILDDPDVLQDLVAAVDLALHTIVSPPEHSDPYRALFTGRPLALIRARARVELAAPPLYDATWARIPAGPQATDGNQLRKTGWRVRIGDPFRRTDGMVALFRAPESASDPIGTDYSRCHVAHMPRDPRSTYLQALDTKADPAVIAAEPLAGPSLASPAVPNGAAAWVTLLVSPWTPVHAFTGLLPTAGVQVPEPFLQEPLSRMAVGLRTGPLLAGLRVPGASRPPGIALPVPSAWPGVWSWSERTDDSAGPWQDYDLVGTGTAVRPPTTLPEARSGYLVYTPKSSRSAGS